MRRLSESIFGNMTNKGRGEVVKKEDNVNLLDFDTLAEYIEDTYSEKGVWFAIGESEDEKSRHIEIEIISGITLSFNEVDGKIYNILVQSVNRYLVDVPGLKKVFNVNVLGSSTYSVLEKDWTKSNNTFVKLIEFFLDKKTNESLFGKMSDKGRGETVKKEDDVNLLDLNEFYKYIKDQYKTKVEYIDLDVMGGGNGDVLGVDITEDIILFYKPKRGHILLSWSRVKIPMPFFDELADRFKIENPNAMRRIITEKDGTCTNQTFIDVIDYFLEYNNKIFIKNIKESLFGNMTDKGRGETVKKEDERHKILERLLATYIKLFADSCYYHDEYTSGSYPDFRAYIKDFRDNPRIEEVCPDDSYFDDLLNYVNRETWDNQIDDTIMEMTDRIDKGEHLITDDVIEELRKHNVNESLFGNMSDKGRGETIKKEDELSEEDIDKVKSDLIGFTMSVVNYIKNYELTFDDFYKYLEEIENPDEVKKIIYYVKTHKDECDKLLEKDIKFENKLLDEKVNVYLLRFVDNIVYDEKYHNTLSDIKKFASEIFKSKSSYDFHINKKIVFKDKSELFNDYIEDKWKDGSLKQKIDDLIKNENDEISKYGFVKEPGKTIADTVNDWWDSLDDSKRDELAWDEFGEDAEEEYYSDHNPKYNEYDGEDFEADEWWDGAYGIRKVKIYCSEHSKTNESLFGNMSDKGRGETIKKEDEITEDELKQIAQYITDYGNEVVYGHGRGGEACNLDEFIDYLKTDRKVDDRILKYVKDNWFDEICDEVAGSIEQAELEYNQDMNESLFGNMTNKGRGETTKKEDEVLTDMEINSLNQFILMYCREERVHYIQNHIVPPPPSRRKENDYEGLIKYIEDRRDENMFTNVGDYNKIIRYIKKNWDKLDMDKYIKKYIFSPDMMKGTKIVECEGVPGGLTPADVGGMGAAYFPGPNGEPGSGDLPSPTGIVYHQVAPFTMFLKQGKRKKKRTKKFRKEDEPCVHSPNAKVYDYVDDFREYVDRTYNNMDRK